MQNTLQKFREHSIVSEKTGILSEHLKTLNSNYPTVQYLLLKLRTHFLLTSVYKTVCVIFFLFYLDLELFSKTRKYLVSAHSFFILLLITQDLKKIKKSHRPFCKLYWVESMCKISEKNIKLYGSWSLPKF